MLTQIKYALRDQITLRGTALVAAIVVNLLLRLIFGHESNTQMVISSLLLCGMLIICFISDLEAIRSLFRAPISYLTALAPVRSGKILFSRTLVIFLGDILCMAVGIWGILIQMEPPYDGSFEWMDLLFCLIYTLYYLQFILTFFFGASIARSFLSGFKANGFISFLISIAVLYLLTLFDYILIPLSSSTSQYGINTSIMIDFGINAATLVFIALLVFKSALLFFATTYLMERKINL